MGEATMVDFERSGATGMAGNVLCPFQRQKEAPLLREVRSHQKRSICPSRLKSTGKPADCTGGANGPNDENRLVAGQLGPEGGETRSSTTTPFDNASDYNGLVIGPGITDPTGAALPGLGAFTASIAVANQALGAVPASDSLLITVTVTGPGDTTVVLHGYRVRYAPNALP